MNFKDFLSNRHLNVRFGSTISENFEQKMGVPQGSILSITLFNLKINSIADVNKNDMQGN